SRRAAEESRRAEDEKVLRHAAEVAKQEAQDNEQKAVMARREAEENFAEARDAVRELTLISQRRLAHEPHMELVRREMLQTALGFHQRFLTRHGDRPGLRFQANLARLRVGEIEEQLGNLEAAEKGYRDTIAALDTRPAEKTDSRPPREHRLALATAWNDLALLLQTRQRAEPALEAMDRAVRLRQ